MEQVYCELHEDTARRLHLPKYVSYITDDFGHMRGKGRVVNGSERVWVQRGSRIRFAKNRLGDPVTMKVDMEEFMWIKLKSVNI
jgi:hypothetical protein